MWKIRKDQLSISLPEDFYLMEDEDFVYLYYGEKKLACFLSTSVDPKEIERVAKEYVNHIQKGGNII